MLIGLHSASAQLIRPKWTVTILAKAQETKNEQSSMWQMFVYDCQENTVAELCM